MGNSIYQLDEGRIDQEFVLDAQLIPVPCVFTSMACQIEFIYLIEHE
jgi:hypothetical protein